MLCPKCYKALQIDDSKISCEFCGYEIDSQEAKECPVCYSVQPKDVEKCENCGYDFNSRKAETEIYEMPQNAIERLKAADSTQKPFIIIRWCSYATMLILIITCLCVCLTPIAYNCKYYYDAPYGKNIYYVFKQNQTYKTYIGNDLRDTGIYNIDGNQIFLYNNNNDSFQIESRTKLKKGSYIYKAKNVGEGFLIFFSVLFSVVSIVLFFKTLLKKNDQ